ncbi:MAG: hypothetical protein KDE28_02815, partial [Anaerolineales bacterium]|nr:hypothetical protein [Anaerolineales bacterium]
MTKRAQQAYVLRLWRENPQSHWRASLVDARTTEQVHFARLAELVAFLEARTGEMILSWHQLPENQA